MIKAYSFNLSDEEKKCISSFADILGEHKIYDLRSYEVKANTDDILLLFGRKAVSEAENIECRAKLYLPEPYQLDTTYGIEEIRQESKKKVNNLKKILNSKKTQKQIIEEKSLPHEIVYAQIEESLRKKGVTEWTGTNQNGKTIRITINPEESKADINLTFAELFMLKQAMEIFQVRELELISNINKEGNNKPN